MLKLTASYIFFEQFSTRSSYERSLFRIEVPVSEVTWTGLEVTWNGLEVTWNGSEVTWTGLKVTWTGSEVTCAGSEVTWTVSKSIGTCRLEYNCLPDTTGEIVLLVPGYLAVFPI